MRSRGSPFSSYLYLFLIFVVKSWGQEDEDYYTDETPPEDIIWGQPHKNQAYFDDHTPTNITTIVGTVAKLPCKVQNLADKDVSWIRNEDIHILTVGLLTYTSDDRFRVRHVEGSELWMLEINEVKFTDAGIYECQVSTSPKISLPVNLNVDVQSARILGPTELMIKNGSTISLTCVINTHHENVGKVEWLRDEIIIDYNSLRGGISLETEKTPQKTTSKLFITRAIKEDSGNYTCQPQYADPTSVVVHVVNGEESAAVQTSGVSTVYKIDYCSLLIGPTIVYILLKKRYVYTV